jgi:hypothetical protein
LEETVAALYPSTTNDASAVRGPLFASGLRGAVLFRKAVSKVIVVLRVVRMWTSIGDKGSVAPSPSSSRFAARFRHASTLLINARRIIDPLRAVAAGWNSAAGPAETERARAESELGVVLSHDTALFSDNDYASFFEGGILELQSLTLRGWPTLLGVAMKGIVSAGAPVFTHYHTHYTEDVWAVSDSIRYVVCGYVDRARRVVKVATPAVETEEYALLTIKDFEPGKRLVYEYKSNAKGRFDVACVRLG